MKRRDHAYFVAPPSLIARMDKTTLLQWKMFISLWIGGSLGTIELLIPPLLPIRRPENLKRSDGLRSAPPLTPCSMIAVEMFDYYTAVIDHTYNAWSVPSILLAFIAGSCLVVNPSRLGVALTSESVLIAKFYYLFKESPRRIPTMVTLCFILAANFLLLCVAVRHALTIHPYVLSWEGFLSLFRIEASHVLPLPWNSGIRPWIFVYG